jgi:ADP-ribose pyrophosphatase YjhB (NUDIX family)
MKEPSKVVTRAIILVNGKVLLGKREHGNGANQYALVGGKPKGNESPEDAVVREVNEELGILFKNIKPWKTELDKKTVPGESWDVYFFYGEGEGELKLKKDEILDTILVGKEDLPNIDFAFDHRAILEQFFEDVNI